MPDRLEEIVWYLCSPLGYAQVEHYTGSVISAAKKVGINLPDDAKTWEDVEPAWIMAQLRKL
jgi:hypothetical protein